MMSSQRADPYPGRSVTPLASVNMGSHGRVYEVIPTMTGDFAGPSRLVSTTHTAVFTDEFSGGGPTQLGKGGQDR